MYAVGHMRREDVILSLTAALELTLERGWQGLACVLFFSIMLFPLPDVAQAQAFGSAEECQTYTGDAHISCLYAYIERQQKRLSEIEAQVGSPGQQFVPQETMFRDIPAPVPASAAGQRYMDPALAPGFAYAGYGYPGIPYWYPPYGAGFGLSAFPGLGISIGVGGPGYYVRPFNRPRYLYRSPGFYRPRFSFGPRLYRSHVYPGSRFYSGSRFHSGYRSFGRHHR